MRPFNDREPCIFQLMVYNRLQSFVCCDKDLDVGFQVLLRPVFAPSGVFVRSVRRLLVLENVVLTSVNANDAGEVCGSKICLLRAQHNF